MKADSKTDPWAALARVNVRGREVDAERSKLQTHADKWEHSLIARVQGYRETLAKTVPASPIVLRMLRQAMADLARVRQTQALLRERKGGSARPDPE